MSEQVQEPIIPLQIPASHLRVILAGLGKLPLEVAGPVDTAIKSQIAQLAALAQKQKAEFEAKAAAEGKQSVKLEDVSLLPTLPASNKKAKKNGTGKSVS